ncbi:MAG: nucleobase:cation symporter-2 family protein [Gammaproteobacteria bacterium]|nr:nucleobase:cation symporter-2 family protein [Gammaproteobacteria bacterium]
MSNPQQASELIYQLDDRPPPAESFFAALQHVLASLIGIMTPPLIITSALGLSIADSAYIISMSLFVSGVATFIQARRFGPVGSGLLSVQGTSFAFVGPIIGATLAVQAEAGVEAALATMFGVIIVGAFIEIFLSRFLHLAKRIITPVVTGVVVTLIGLTLIKVGLIAIGGGFYVMTNVPDAFATLTNLGLAGMVLAIILFLNMSKNPMLRMSSIVIGLAVGYVVAAMLGMIDFSRLNSLSAFSVPVPFKYGIDFSFAVFLPVAIIYLITAVESIGDLTATSMISRQPVSGKKYMKRIKGGVLADGINSALAGIFCTFPNTTFSQNNGVIQLTGVASRYVAFFIAGIFVFLGLSPLLAGVFRIMPEPVLGGATILMFGTVAVAGIRILATQHLGSRDILIVAVSLGIGLGVTMVPDILKNIAPPEIKNVFTSGITAGGLTAILLSLVLPERKSEQLEMPPADSEQPEKV